MKLAAVPEKKDEKMKVYIVLFVLNKWGVCCRLLCGVSVFVNVYVGS